MSDDSDDNPTYEDEFALGADDDYDDKGGIISGGYVEEIEDSSSSSDAAQQEEKIRRSRRSRLTVASSNPKYVDSSSSEEDAQYGGDFSYFEENDGEEEVEQVGTKNAKRSSPRKRSSSSRSTAIEDKELPNRLPRRSRGRAVSLNPKNKSSFANVDYVENEKNISEEIYNDGQELEEVGKRENVKRLSPRKRGSSSKSSAKESAPPKTISSKLPKSKVEDDIEGTDAKDHKNDNKPSAKSPHKSESSAKDDNFSAENEGIDILIPHSLLNISRQSRKECNMLVQVEPNDEEASMHLDFIGQSGAIGRFEADENGGEIITILISVVLFTMMKGYFSVDQNNARRDLVRSRLFPCITCLVIDITAVGKCNTIISE